MARSNDHVPFKLGTFSMGDGPPFGGVVLDGKAIRLPALASLGLDEESRLSGSDSILGLLTDWDRNFQSLQKIVYRLTESDRARGLLADELIPIEQLKVLLP